MSGIVLATGAYALTATELIEAWKPVIGFRNLVTFTNITATTETDADPASNMSNPSTTYRWTASSTATTYITCLFGAERQINYAGIERHNWHTAGLTLTIQALPLGGDAGTDAHWVTVVAGHTPADDGTRIWWFKLTGFIGLRWKLESATVAPFAAVAFVGKLLILQNGVPPGHTPITFGDVTRESEVGATGGDHLGIAITSRHRAGTIVQQNIDPDRYRDEVEPFRLAFRDGSTFLFAWAPEEHPDEVGYCWRGGDATPSISRATGEIDITFPIKAVVL